MFSHNHNAEYFKMSLDDFIHYDSV